MTAKETIPWLSHAAAAYSCTPPVGWDTLLKIECDHFGYLAKKDNTLVVAFRGTETLHEWLHDATVFIMSTFYGKGHVHSGFQFVYKDLRDEVLNKLRLEKDNFTSIVTVGHSLGGALAVLCAGDISREFKNVSSVTFAAPHVGMSDYTGWLKSCVPITSVVNTLDEVPRLPRWPYVPQGDLIKVTGLHRELAAAHSLSVSYLPALELLCSKQLKDLDK